MQPKIGSSSDTIQRPAALQSKNNAVRMVIDTTGKQLYLRQVECLIAKDVEKLVNENYNEDAVLVSVNSIVTGRSALIKHFNNYLSQVNIMKVKSTDAFVEAGDVILFEATIESDRGTSNVYDAFVLQHGKISYHFTGVK